MYRAVDLSSRSQQRSRDREEIKLNPFKCGSFGIAHRMAWGLISPDIIGLFWPLPPGETTSPHSCGPIAEAHFVPLLIWLCKLLRKAGSSHPSPPDFLCCSRATAKIGCSTWLHTAFWAWRLNWNKKCIKGSRKSLDIAFLPFLKFKNNFTNIKTGKMEKNILP